MHAVRVEESKVKYPTFPNFRLRLLNIKQGFSPVGHGRIFDGSRPSIIEIGYVMQDDSRKPGLLLP